LDKPHSATVKSADAKLFSSPTSADHQPSPDAGDRPDAENYYTYYEEGEAEEAESERDLPVTPFLCTVDHPYIPYEEGHLELRLGDVIKVERQFLNDKDTVEYYYGTKVDDASLQGWFPVAYVSK
jgi:hypothetical protein